MTIAVPPNIANNNDAETPAGSDDAGLATSETARESWEAVRDDSDIQFDPIEIPPIPPREPSWFEEALEQFFRWLGELFGPFGTAIANAWPVLQWVLLAALIAFILYLIARTIGPLARSSAGKKTEEVPEWQPDRRESLALLEDADRLAAEGRFDEATHLLLQRSVGQIANARPDWVEPSSTARELASLSALPDAARAAFGTIAERVERSLFALRALDRTDWETARAAYAEFALAKIEGRMIQRRPA